MNVMSEEGGVVVDAVAARNFVVARVMNDGRHDFVQADVVENGDVDIEVAVVHGCDGHRLDQNDDHASVLVVVQHDHYVVAS